MIVIRAGRTVNVFLEREPVELCPETDAREVS